MTEFVYGGVAGVFGVSTAKLVGEDPDDIGRAVGEAADVGDTSRCRAKPCARPADDGFDGLLVREVSGIDGGDVDVEGRIGLGDARPNSLNRCQFAGAEACGIAVQIEGGGGGDVVWAQDCAEAPAKSR